MNKIIEEFVTTKWWSDPDGGIWRVGEWTAKPTVRFIRKGTEQTKLVTVDSGFANSLRSIRDPKKNRGV